MDKRIELLAELADDEFDGECLNGPSFMKTLESLSPEVAAWKDTWEGFSAWEIAQHCGYYKHFLAEALGANPGPNPFAKDRWGFGSVPAQPDEAAWKALLSALRASHKAVWDAARAASTDGLDATFPAWKMSFSKAIAWLATHDTFHGAQLRSMGVPGLKSKADY